jgi:MFS family permease
MLATLLIGGALADRYPRRTLMIISDVARLVVMVVLAVVDATGHLNIGLLVALALCYGLGDGFFYPAFGGIIPLVVDQHHIASANAMIGLSRQGAFVAGPALAAALYGLAGSASVFAFNAASFAVAAVLMLAARPRAIEPEPPKGTSARSPTGFASSSACRGCGSASSWPRSSSCTRRCCLPSSRTSTAAASAPTARSSRSSRSGWRSAASSSGR